MNKQELWDRAVSFHGHVCPGLMIDRIKEMEEALDVSAAAIRDLTEALDGYEAVVDRIHQLEEYYDSGDWRADFEADEAGLVPEDLKRGVLSEDALYDLLTEHEEVRKRMRKAENEVV